MHPSFGRYVKAVVLVVELLWLLCELVVLVCKYLVFKLYVKIRYSRVVFEFLIYTESFFMACFLVVLSLLTIVIPLVLACLVFCLIVGSLFGLLHYSPLAWKAITCPDCRYF
jgi:hypothetical protein